MSPLRTVLAASIAPRDKAVAATHVLRNGAGQADITAILTALHMFRPLARRRGPDAAPFLALIAAASGAGQTELASALGLVLRGHITPLDPDGPAGRYLTRARIDDLSSRAALWQTGRALGSGRTVTALRKRYAQLYAYWRDPRDGINIEVGTNSTVTINGTGSASLYQSGAINAGDDAISVELVGDVVTTIVSDGDIAAGADGVKVRQGIREADINITRTGRIDAGQNGDGNGVFVQMRAGGSASIDATGDIVAGDNGIYAESFRDGTITINQVGDVTAAEYGVFANIEQDGDIDIDVEGSVSGDFGGVRAFVRGQVINGETEVSVTTVGDIASAGANGIEIDINGARSGTIVATANVNATGAITADANGISVTTEQRGNVTITQEGDVNATRNNGVIAVVDEGTIDIDVDGNVTAAQNGVSATTGGEDDVTISVTGDIAAGVNGIYARSEGGDVSVDFAGNLSGETRGLFVRSRRDFDNDGVGGDTTVTTVGDIAGGEYGINVLSYGGEVNVTHTGDLSGLNIFQANAPGDPGAVTATVTGNVDGPYGVRLATTNDSALALTIEGDVTATNDDGVIIDADGDGLVTVNLAGDITSYEDAVRIDRVGDGDITLNVTGAIDSGETGIDIDIFGSGDVTVAATGDIVADRTALSVRTADLSRGIVLDPDTPVATGDVTITHVGDLTGATGVFARAGSEDDGDVLGTGNVTVNTTGDITGEDYSVNLDAVNGDVTLTHTGAITSGRFGLDVDVEGDVAGDINLTTVGDVSAYAAAFDASNRSGGDTTLSSTGDIESEAGDGINADSLGGAISITSVGDVTAGDDGIVGGIGGRGTVTISQTGNVTAGADGIAVQTLDVSNNTVTLADGAIQGGTDGAGVRFVTTAGSTNSLTTNSAVTIGALSGLAIIGGDGDDTINNGGTVTGTIDLGTGANAFNNLAGATAQISETLIVGDGNSFTNAGVLIAANEGAVATTTVTGNVAQSDSGTLVVDLDLGAGTADLLDVSGTATVGGALDLQFAGLSATTQEVTILSAAGGVTDAGLSFANTGPILTADVSFPNANDVVVRAVLDFTAPSADLNETQSAMGTYFNDTFNAGPEGIEPLLTSLLNNVSTAEDYAAALEQLSPDSYLHAQTAAAEAATAFSDGLFSCAVAGQLNAAIGEGQCYWLRTESGNTTFDGTDEIGGFDASQFSTSAGAQFGVAPNWYVNGGLGLSRSTVETDTANSDIDQLQAGVAVKYQAGPWAFGAALSGGTASFETERNVTIGAPETLTSDYDASFVTAQLRGAYLAEIGSWYIKPAIDLPVTMIDTDGFDETGGASALSVDGSSATFVQISPSLEIGTEYANDGRTFRPFAKLGVTQDLSDDQSLDVAFAGGPAGIDTFNVQGDGADTFADLALGLTVFDDAGRTFSVGYEGQFSDDTVGQSAFAKVSFKF